MVICLERGADLHMAQLMPLPLTVCCFSIIDSETCVDTVQQYSCYILAHRDVEARIEATNVQLTTETDSQLVCLSASAL